MQDMKKLAQLLKEVEDQLVVCMRCGMCQSVCPVFAETGRESDVARGKLALLDGLLQEMFKDPTGVQDRLSRCLLCGSCAANCPSGVKVLDIFIKARAIITNYVGLSPLKKIIFRKMLSQPELFDRLLEWGSKFQGIFVKPVDDLLGTSCARFVSPLGDRHFSSLAPEPFHRMVPSLDTPAGASGLKVAFFTGCVIDKVFPRIGTAALRTLKHHGVGVFIPKEVGCCGIPALSSGDTDTFNKLILHNLKGFGSRNFDYLVTACATCTSTIKKLWPTMAEELTPGELDRVKALAEKTMDISQFLVEKVGVKPEAAGETGEKTLITYHDPCHLKKSLGIAVQPRTVIQANPSYRFKEMKEADKCCGCGGSFNLQYYDLSSAIGKHKRDNIVDSGCSVVATSCPACMLQISDMLSQAGDRVEVKHAIEIYAESLDKK
ncbi:(Fe-S)-binding protein [Desulforhabdus amnigena]|jgi:glycolate oxidase iron-sulfur subunit|uniref:Glycolate oxidase iron-sulfur subunit n=1 Tax=Desulforhabdus amnigena TaxID=40218 RepID=A0A9W6FVJ7_9BACT|nr:(Fe-S)-binding protein [Desulforhabdus amnigena]NLJ28914.1 (Fe-S)-binding protein [Deltaproteobacteria bacterium]GLI35649.1 glycolate oxidase iron-sulfur subunit [Desulforhabdus amnigena]